jgi:hypothetical protein
MIDEVLKPHETSVGQHVMTAQASKPREMSTTEVQHGGTQRLQDTIRTGCEKVQHYKA